MTLTDAAPMATAPEPDEPADSYANLVDAVAGLVRFAALRPDPDGHRMSEVVIPSRDEIEAHLLQREAEHPWWEPVAVLGLTATELLVLLVAVAAEVSLDVERECERLTAGRASRTSLGLAMGLLADDARGARQVRELCEPGGLLVGHGIVELHADERSTSSLAQALVASTLVTSMLVGTVTGPAPPFDVYLTSAAAIASGDRAVGRGVALPATPPGLPSAAHPVTFVRAGREADSRAGAGAIAASLGCALIEVDAASIASNALLPAIRYVELLRRLHDAVVLIGGIGADEVRLREVVGAWADRPSWDDGRPVLVHLDRGTDVPPSIRSCGATVVIEDPTDEEVEAGWTRGLAEQGIALAPAELALLADRYRFDPVDVGHVARSAWAVSRDGPPGVAEISHAAAGLGASALGALATRVAGAASWDDLVLPPVALAELHHLVDVIHQRREVAALGVGRRGRAPGIAAVFAGPSGTGKTLAASVVASALGADLYRVDLATVVSKYIGETEKNLDRIFAAAECSGAVVLFDEADAIFGKRFDASSSTDRHSNLETAFLLQRIEAYRGVVLLTTNLRHHIDPAFLRRFAAIVEFVEPAEPERRLLWDLALGTALERDDDLAAGLDQLAQAHVLTGGQIAVIASNVATVALAAGRPLRSADLAWGIARLEQQQGR